MYEIKFKCNDAKTVYEFDKVLDDVFDAYEMVDASKDLDSYDLFNYSLVNLILNVGKLNKLIESGKVRR